MTCKNADRLVLYKLQLPVSHKRNRQVVYKERIFFWVAVGVGMLGCRLLLLVIVVLEKLKVGYFFWLLLV